MQCDRACTFLLAAASLAPPLPPVDFNQNRLPPLPACLQGVLEHITVNNFPIGRNVDEAMRTLQVGGTACSIACSTEHDTAGRCQSSAAAARAAAASVAA